MKRYFSLVFFRVSSDIFSTYIFEKLNLQSELNLEKKYEVSITVTMKIFRETFVKMYYLHGNICSVDFLT